MTKMTKVEKMNMAISFMNRVMSLDIMPEESETIEIIKDFLDSEKALLEKKNARKSESKGAIVNEEIQKNILSVLAENIKPLPVADLIKKEGLSSYEETVKGETVTKDMSGQKMTALLKKLINSGQVARVEIERRAYFYIPDLWNPEEEKENEEK